MKESNKRRLKISMTGWIFVPMLLMSIFVMELIYREVPPGWKPRAFGNTGNLPEEVAGYVVERPDFSSFKWEGEGLITLWFDDAWLSQYENAYPMLKERGYKGTIAVPTEYIGYESYLSWDQLRDLQKNGWEVTSHSVSHDCAYIEEDINNIEQELVESKRALLREGLMFDNYVTPCGKVSDELVRLVKKHYKSLRLIGHNLNVLPVRDPYTLEVIGVDLETPLIEIEWWMGEAKRKNMWLILMFHQVEDKENLYGNDIKTMNEILNAVERLDLKVVLPAEVLSIK